MRSSRKKLKRADWLIPGALIILSTVPVVAGTARIVELAGGAEVTSQNARFFASPLPVVLHIFSVAFYAIMGALQFSPALRRRRPRWHRTIGWLLVPSGLIAALSGLWMAQFYPWPEGDGELLYALRLLFGSAMILSILFGVTAIRRRDFSGHGDWMIRAYAIGLGAGTQVLTHLSWLLLFGVPNEFARALLMGAGWVINLAAAEWLIRKKRTRRARPRLTSSISV